jgi:hypothetical protein
LVLQTRKVIILPDKTSLKLIKNSCRKNQVAIELGIQYSEFPSEQQISMSRMHRSQKGPFNTFSKKFFFKKGFYRSKLARELNFYARIIIEGSKSLKKGQKMLKKDKNLV